MNTGDLLVVVTFLFLFVCLGMAIYNDIQEWKSERRPDLKQETRAKIAGGPMDQYPNRIKDELASSPPHGFYTNLPSPEYYEQMLNDQRRYPSSLSDTRVPQVYQDAKSWQPDALNVTKQVTKPKRDKRGRYCR